MQKVFKALADETRREILFLLMEKEMSVKEILEQVSIPNSTLSHHLEILYNSGLVSKRKVGTFIIYSVAMSMVEEMVAYVTKKFQQK